MFSLAQLAVILIPLCAFAFILGVFAHKKLTDTEIKDLNAKLKSELSESVGLRKNLSMHEFKMNALRGDIYFLENSLRQNRISLKKANDFVLRQKEEAVGLKSKNATLEKENTVLKEKLNIKTEIVLSGLDVDDVDKETDTSFSNFGDF